MNKIFLLFVFYLTIICTEAEQINTTLLFHSGKSHLTKTSLTSLDSLAQELLKSGYFYRIVINGHCDSDGSHEFNQLLSESRIHEVFMYLQKKGIDTSVIERKAFGETLHVEDNKSEEGKMKNRRVEIVATIIKHEKVVAPDKTEEIVEVKKDTIQKKPDNYFGLENLKAGQKIVLKNMNFKGGSAEMLPESLPALQKLLQVMKANPTLEIQINGHVCCAPQKSLSTRRAKVVYRYLIENGIDKKRLKYAGFSNRVPLVPENSEAQRKMNRRVEIMILKK